MRVEGELIEFVRDLKKPECLPVRPGVFAPRAPILETTRQKPVFSIARQSLLFFGLHSRGEAFHGRDFVIAPEGVDEKASGEKVLPLISDHGSYLLQ